MRQYLIVLASLSIAALGPVLALSKFYYLNSEEVVAVEPIIVAGTITSSMALALTFIVSLTRWWRPEAGVILGIAGFVFWSFPWTDLSDTAAISGWVALSLLFGLIVGWPISRHVYSLTGSAAAVALASVIMMVAADGHKISNTDNNTSAASSFQGADPSTNLRPAQPERLAFVDGAPNVYLLIIDELGRPDVTAFSNPLSGSSGHPLPATLTSLGFELDRLATANFAELNLSNPSVLEGAYRVKPGSASSIGAARSNALATASGNHEMAEWFRRHGYQHWHAPDRAFEKSTCMAESVDRCLSPALQNLENDRTLGALFDVTPVKTGLGTSARAATTEQLNAVEFAKIATIDIATQQNPRLVIGHIHAHDRDNETSCVTSGDDKSTPNFSQPSQLPEAQTRNATRSKCFMADFEKAASMIVAADPEALVIVQASHGPAAEVEPSKSLDQMTRAEIWQRFGVFRMYRLPETCDTESPWSSSLVNTVPLLQSCILGEPANYKKPEMFLTRPGTAEIEKVKNLEGGLLHEVCQTGTVKQAKNCIELRTPK